MTAFVSAQNTRPAYVDGPAPPTSVLTAPPTQLKPIRPNAPPPGTYRIFADLQEKEGKLHHLRGRAEIETSEMLLTADEIDYDDESGEAEARGHVHFQNFTHGEKLQADRVEYNVDEQTGKFFEVSGTSPAKIEARPGVLTTSNPFYFQGKWAERKQDKYILHDGFVTDCKMPSAWWILRGSAFDIIPGNRAIAHRSVFLLRHVPLFYAPAFYKSLKKNPRKSGFLIPSASTSSTRGNMVELGYFWAINRSYDVTYWAQYYTTRGFAHNVNLRGKVNDRTDFDAVVFGLNDRGIKVGDNLIKQGGVSATLGARSELPKDWHARVELNYLTSFEFRQAFAQSFHEAIYAESHSIGYVTKHWSSFGVNIVADRDEVFQIATSNADDRIIVKKLPEFQFISRERAISNKILPIWVSLESSAGLLNRDQPFFSTREFVDRVDFAPRIMTAAYWKGFSLVPAFSARETHYGSSQQDGTPVGRDFVRSSREFILDLALPSLARIYEAPKWMKVSKLKHVIETRASYRDVRGIDDFSQIIRFDETELYTNTQELEVSITNRFYTKDRNGGVNEVLSWQVWQRRYFDPTFGGAIETGRRNVIMSSADLTGYAFLDQPRNYSPVVSALRYAYKIGIEWRTDYDPFRGHFTNSSINADWRRDKYYVRIGHNQVRNDPVLAPNSNQFSADFGIGNQNRRGWNAGSRLNYDYRKQIFQGATTQVTYNTDCCGFTVQYQRLDVGILQNNQVRFAFAVANIGSFGSLKKQERFF